MEQIDFDKHVENLLNEITMAISEYCVRNSLQVDWVDFLNGTTQDLDTLAREILFYGVEVFPVQRSADQLRLIA